MNLKDRIKRTRNQLDYLLDKFTDIDQEVVEYIKSELRIKGSHDLTFLEEGIEGNIEVRKHFNEENKEELIEHRQTIIDRLEKEIKAVEFILDFKNVGKEDIMKENADHLWERYEQVSVEQEQPIEDSSGEKNVERYGDK